MSEYTRLARKANRVQKVVESAVARAVLGADSRAKVMRLFGAELAEAGSKVRGDFFLVIATSTDGSELGVHLEGNKLPAITSHVVYPALESEEGPALYAGAEDAVTHFLTGFSPQTKADFADEELLEGEAA